MTHLLLTAELADRLVDNHVPVDRGTVTVGLDEPGADHFGAGAAAGAQA